MLRKKERNISLYSSVNEEFEQRGTRKKTKGIRSGESKITRMNSMLQSGIISLIFWSPQYYLGKSCIIPFTGKIISILVVDTHAM